MARYAIIRNGAVENVVEWDGDSETWGPPEGCTAVESATAGVGDLHDGGVFTQPEPEPPKKTEAESLVDMLVTRGVLTQKNADDWRAERRR